MKHKVLSVLFATVFTAGMLAGCGSSDTASQKQEMTLEEESTAGKRSQEIQKTQLKMNPRKILLKIQNPWKRMQKTVRKRNLMMVQIKLPQQELQ